MILFENPPVKDEYIEMVATVPVGVRGRLEVGEKRNARNQVNIKVPSLR